MASVRLCDRCGRQDLGKGNWARHLVMRTLELPVVYSNGEQIVHNLELCVTCRGDFEDWLRDPEVDHTPEGLRGTP